MKIKIAENIKKLRKERSLTQEQLAEALGVTIGAVYKWEAGLSIPEIRLIMEMADFFEISIDVLLGYEKQKGNVEIIIERIQQHLVDKNCEEAVSEAEKALKKYPNHFEIVYVSAVTYQLQYVENRCEAAMNRSNELFYQAISLLYQNTHQDINEATILNRIAENYLEAEKMEQALEILKQNNVCGMNNSLIGFTYARTMKQPEVAKPYLMKSFASSLNEVILTMAGLAYMYAEEQREVSIEVVDWLSDFLDSVKKYSDSIAFTDKIKVPLLAQGAIWEASLGQHDKSEEYIRNAYNLAKRFDATPTYDMQEIRFVQGDNLVAYDDIGKTAMEAVEKIIFDEERASKAQEEVQAIWKILNAFDNEGKEL